MEQEINLYDYISVIKRRWKTILLIAVIVAVAAFVNSIRKTPTYEAKTTILIRSGGGSSLSQLAGLAGMMGFNVPSGGDGGSIGDFTELVQSKAVAEKVLEDLRLKERAKGWNDPKLSHQKLVLFVQGSISKPKTKGNLVELKASFNDPVLVAEIANGYIDALSKYWHKLNYTEARKKKEYIESQLPRVEKDLKNAEQKLKKFTLLSPKGSLSSVQVGLKGLVAGTQTQGIEVSRLSRELDIQSSVYTMLRKEYESVKLEESKEFPPFSVVDSAYPPERPSKPRKKMDTLVGLIFGIFLGTLVAFGQENWAKIKKILF